MPRIGSASLNNIKYWNGVYSHQEYPTRGDNNRVRYEAAASMQAGMSALDVGCGQAGLGRVLLGQQPDHFFYLGCDFSDAAVRSHVLPEGRDGQWHLVVCDWREIGAFGQFETVYLCEMLEHVEEPAQLLALAVEAARLRIVITVPRYQKLSWAEHRGEHAWDFTLEELAQLAKPYGRISEPMAASRLCWAMNITLGEANACSVSA